MGSYETPEEIERRRALLARFARLNVEREQKRRLRIQLEPKKEPERHFDPWKTEEDREKYQRQQLEYITPYTEEYKAGFEKSDNAEASASQSTSQVDDERASTISDTTSSTTVSNGGDVVAQLVYLKNQKRKSARKIKLAGANGGMTDECDKTCKINTAESANLPLAFSYHPPAPSTCNEFERTSTIMPPTEVTNGEFDSNISVEEIKKHYFKNYKTNTELPIYKQRRQIIDSINSYSVVIIEGATGCGKTTQVPTYILEEAILERPSTTGAPVIYVTQPRRIAARSIAQRVCAEHDWNLPSIVGYQVGLEKNVGPQTILVFCTAGVLLQKIIQDKSLKKYTHIIIDEAHERDADTDLLLMMIRKLMFSEMAVFRLVIMSATMDIDKLRRYFTFRTNYGHQAETSPSYIRIGSTSNRSISNLSSTTTETSYLNTMNLLLGIPIVDEIPEFDIEQAELFEECLRIAVKIIIEIVPRLDTFNEKSKSTLVFLPGLAEISRLDRMLRQYEGATNFLDIIPLHSCLTVRDQLRVFDTTRPGCRKVILATNIAESSITVADVGFIVDFCLTKSLIKDTVTRFPTLKLHWSTQDKCTQRSGRTGRCCPGKVFRMVPHSFFKRFKEYAEPELLTAPLELSVLRVKNFQMGEIKALFAIVMDPPPFDEIRTAVLELKQMGALSATYNGQLSDIDGDLTELGRVISALPIDVHLSKLIVVAAVFDVLKDAIIVAACLSTNRTVVRYLYGDPMETYEVKLGWARGSQSDLFLSLDCYKEFKEYKEDKHKTFGWLANWCSKNHLDVIKLQDVDALVEEITQRLESVNIFANNTMPNQERDANMDSLMLKVAFCAAFYPNYFLTSPLDAEKIKKELNGYLDPTRTVFMSGLPVSQAPIYKSQLIKRIFEDADSFDFIAENSRAYLVFNEEKDLCPQSLQNINDAIEAGRYDVVQKSRNVPLSIYRALKIGETMDIQIREYEDEVATDRMNFYYRQKEAFAKRVGNKLIPSCMKVLGPGQQADNQCLCEVTDSNEYMRVYEQRPYIEVEFDAEQDRRDQYDLMEIENYELKQNDKCVDHEIYKPVWKRIRGPDSPIRMSFQSVLCKSKGFAVEIDSQSVNSILLDPEYLEARRQMLVAASVAQSRNGRVMARDTTLMPNIRGLPSLMGLLFAQYYRLIYNNELDCLAGAVFGIGWKESDAPLDGDYQVDLGFDVLITPDDIALINKARRMMSQLLKFTEIQNAGKPQASLQDDLRKVILVLMRTRRYPLVELDISVVDYPKAPENIFTKDAHNMPSDILRDGETRSFLPLAHQTRQVPESNFYQRVRANLEHLNRVDQNLEPMPPCGIKCLVCGNGYKSHFILSLKVENHLRSDGHIRKLRNFEAFEAQFKLRQQA